VGLEEIDGGISRAEHSWICALEDCDLFFCSTRYISMMWDQMKQFKSHIVHDLLKKCPAFNMVTEQTLYTIACDIAEFREYQPGDVICQQDLTSPYNLNQQQLERNALVGLKQFDADMMPKLESAISPNWDETQKIYQITDRFNLKTQEIKEFRRMCRMKGIALPKPKPKDEDSDEDEEEREKEKDLQVDPQEREAKQTLKKMLQSPEVRRFKDICDFHMRDYNLSAEAIKISNQVLIDYKKARSEMLPDSDGIYIMVKGAVKVTNKIDKKETEIQPAIQVNFCFGDSKFLAEPSWTYFGDVTAITPPETQQEASFEI
jgi:hypothetical protein